MAASRHWNLLPQAHAGQRRKALRLYGRLRALVVYHDDDRVFRAELRCWAASGDRLGLDKAMRDYAAWLQRDYGVEPEAETHVLFEALWRRQVVHGKESPSQPTGD